MRLIKPSFKIIEQQAGLEGIYKQIELAGRTCYKSEDKITEDSAKGFVDRMIKSGHGAMLEHGTVYLKVPFYNANCVDFPHGALDCATHSPYSKISHGPSQELEGLIDWTGREISTECMYITTNYRVIVENDALCLLEYLCEPTEYHEKRICVRFICDRGVSHEFVRHRVMSFAQESTRYCNYSKDKFNGELTFIQPVWAYHQEDGDYGTLGALKRKNVGNKDGTFFEFIKSLQYAELYYFRLLKEGWKPQQARAILPNSLKTELVVTGFVSDWEHFFKLRCATNAHPQARELASPLHQEFLTRGYL